MPSHDFLNPKISPAKPQRSLEDLLTQAGKHHVLAVKLSVPDRLVKPHSLVAGWISARQSARKHAKENGSTWTFQADPGPFTENDNRRHRILSALFKAIELQGGRVEEGVKGQLFICEDRDQLEISLREKKKRVRVPLTDQQRSWRPHSDETHKWDMQPTGFLIFEIKSYVSSPVQKNWVENQSVRLEDELGLIVPNLFAALQLVRESRLLREEDSRRYQQRQLEAAVARQRSADEQKRWDSLVQIAHDWKDRQLVLEFLRSQMNEPDGITALTGEMTECDWIDWVQSRLGQALTST